MKKSYLKEIIRGKLNEIYDPIVTGYHVTKKENLNSILSNGIIPNKNKTYSEFEYPDLVFFSTTLKGAKQNLIDISTYLKKELKDMVVIEFKFQQHKDGINYFEDEEMGNNSWWTQSKIDKKHIINHYLGDEFIKINYE